VIEIVLRDGRIEHWVTTDHLVNSGSAASVSAGTHPAPVRGFGSLLPQPGAGAVLSGSVDGWARPGKVARIVFPMKLTFTQKEFQQLLELTHLGMWVVTGYQGMRPPRPTLFRPRPEDAGTG